MHCNQICLLINTPALTHFKTFLSLLLIPLSDQTVEKQAENLRDISSRYDHDKKKWTEAINDLQGKIKVSDENAGSNYLKDSVIILTVAF